MIRQQISKWSISFTLVMSLLSACGAASPTPVEIAPIPTSTPLPPLPRAALPRATAIPATATKEPVSLEPTTSPEGTLTPKPSPTLKDPIDRPFLMRIDRISVIVGRGTLLEGRVANGTLQATGAVEIISPQNKVISPSLVAIFISNTPRDHVTVGGYASILVGGIEATSLSPGMLLAAAGEYKSYEEALQQLQ